MLPIFYIGVLKIDTTEALALSFTAFIISGVLASVNYYKKGQLDIKYASILSIGSFVSAFLGVRLNLLIPLDIVEIILYGVVLVSGLSILFRNNKESGKKYVSNLCLIIIGFITGLICSITGAGGPIIVLPILLLLGIGVKQSVAISLFNSIFIAIPSAIGYTANSDMAIILEYMSAVIIGHVIGVYLGSSKSDKVDKNKLKLTIGIVSVLIAIWKLFF